MGVSIVAHQPIPEGKSGQQVLDSIQALIEGLGAMRSGTFTVDCETFQSAPALGTQRTVNLLHNTEHPATCFAVLDSGSCLTADLLFSQLMHKLQHVYPVRKNTRAECKGQRFELGDFLIKVGSCGLGQNQNFRGILVEVEYRPCHVAIECLGLLREMILGIVSNTDENLSVSLKVTSQDTLYKPSDTILQYLEHFNTFRQLAPVVQR